MMIGCHCGHRTPAEYRAAHPYCDRPSRLVWDGRRLVEQFLTPDEARVTIWPDARARSAASFYA